MSKYTTELRYICEHEAGYSESQGYDKIDEIISESRSKIFDFNYPIFDSSYKSVLETKILKHYYTREIGFETVGLWKHYLNTKMNEIMPYYNKLYESELIEFNPMYNFKYDKTHEGELGGTSTETGSGNISDTVVEANTIAKTGARNIDEDNTIDRDVSEQVTSSETNQSMDKYSDTPQGSVQNLLDDRYLTNARNVNTTGTGTGTNTTDEDVSEVRDYDETNSENVTENKRLTNTGTRSNTGNKTFSNTDEYLEHVEGNNGSKSFSELLKEFRSTFLNIDMLVIEELNELFMGVW